MPYFGGSARHNERPLRWLPLVALAGVVSVAAFDSTGNSTWVAYIAAGALGALLLTGAFRLRSDGATSSLPRQMESGWRALDLELARSRRHDRRFAIVSVPDRLWTPAGAGESERVDAALSAVAVVQGLLRRPDRAWADGSVLLVLLTDCDGVQAQAFLQRAASTMPHLFGAALVSLAVFPDDGVTLGALLASMRAGAGEQTIEASVMEASPQ